MKLYFGGAEIPSHRKLLTEAGVTTLSLSYVGLSRRVKFARPWLISEHFEEGQDVFLDSGAFSVNRNKAITRDEAEQIARGYEEFLALNIDAVSMFSEFDAQILGEGWLQDARERYADIGGDKFLPIWRASTGTGVLDSLARSYARVGVLLDVGLSDQSARHLNQLVDRYGVKLHGVSMTKMEVMRAVKWDSVGSLSWLSPMITGGDTIVWTGRELKRYPKDQKDRARRRHRAWITENGFNSDAIEADDKAEVLKLSVWSWERFVEDINAHPSVVPLPAGVAANPDDGEDLENLEIDPSGAANPTPDALKSELVPHAGSRLPQRRERMLLPLLTRGGNEGSENGSESRTEGVSSRTLMECDKCFLKGKCPQFQPGHECAFEFPAEVTTEPQKRAVLDNLIALQYQRVQRMALFEQMEGGYAMSELSVEMDRLARMLKLHADASRSGFKLEVSASSSGELGAISRIFGREAADQMNALPAPQTVENVADEAGMDITDGEIVP